MSPDTEADSADHDRAGAGPDPVALRPTRSTLVESSSRTDALRQPSNAARAGIAAHCSAVHGGDWALVILVGTLVLSTPLCSNEQVGFWEALFTATSAITVTGLSIIDIGTDLTGFGQLVLAVMILAGGLGLMAITTFLQGFVVKEPLCDAGLTGGGPSMNSASAVLAPRSAPSPKPQPR